MASQIVFRTDGNRVSGLGHLYRCLSLAEILSADFSVSFLISEVTPKEIFNKINFAKVQFQYVPAVTEADEVDWISRFIVEKTLLVIDSYNFTSAYYELFLRSGVKTVVIDDQDNTLLQAYGVINHLVDAQKIKYIDGIKFRFLGPSFAILRKEFLTHNSSAVVNKISFDNVLICVGGSDPDNVTFKIIRSVVELLPQASFGIILGPAFVHSEELTSAVKEMRRIVSFHHSLSASEIIRLVKDSDLAIITPGMISYEFFSVGIPALCGYISSSQKKVVKKYDAGKLAIDVESFGQAALKRGLGKLTSEIAKSQLARQRNLFDGKSGERLIAAFHEMYG